MDIFFIKEVLKPYLRDTFDALTSNGKSGRTYLNIDKIKQYFGMNEFIADRLLTIINANGDERIDFDEWFSFFLKVFMGSPQQKMLIAFKVYDIEGEDCLTRKNVEMVLKHITKSNSSTRYGISFEKEGNLAHSSRNEITQKYQRDVKEIKMLTDCIFNNFNEAIYFEEFEFICNKLTCELYYNVFDHIYQYIPCAQNFFIMKQNFD